MLCETRLCHIVGIHLFHQHLPGTDAQSLISWGGYVPRLCENSKCCRIRGYLDPYPIGDRGLQRIQRGRILKTRFRAEFLHSLCRKPK